MAKLSNSDWPLEADLARESALEPDAFHLGTAEPQPYSADGFERGGADFLSLGEPANDDIGGFYTPAPNVIEASVPRIGIDAFCDRPEILEALAQAGKDRRLAKAMLHLESGGVAAAMERLSFQASPNLLILDIKADPASVLRDLDRLAPMVDPSTKVIVIGGANDIALYRELMRRGISEYLVAPVQPLQFIESIAGLFVDPERPFVGRAFAVAGARGGVGASTIAHNIAYAFAERLNTNTILVDLDLSFGTVALDFNQDSSSGISEALSAPERIDEVFLERLLLKQTERLSLFTAPATLEEEYAFDTNACDLVLERIRRIAPMSVLDVPHVWSAWVKQTLLTSSEVILVATPDLGALRNCKNMVDLLRAARPHDPPPTLVLNQVGMPKRPEVPVKDFSDALGLQPAVIIPFDPAVFGAAANNGQMLFESAPTSKAAMAIDDLVRALTGREPSTRPRASLLSRVPFLKR